MYPVRDIILDSGRDGEKRAGSQDKGSRNPGENGQEPREMQRNERGKPVELWAGTQERRSENLGERRWVPRRKEMGSQEKREQEMGIYCRRKGAGTQEKMLW